MRVRDGGGGGGRGWGECNAVILLLSIAWMVVVRKLLVGVAVKWGLVGP